MILAQILQVIVGSFLCACFLYGLFEFSLWWQSRPLRKFLKEIGKIAGEERSGRTPWQNVLDDYEEYVAEDESLHPEIRKSRIALIRAIADRAEGVS